MDNNGSPNFTPSDYTFMGGPNPENYISYPNSYDMITSMLSSPLLAVLTPPTKSALAGGSPAFNPLALTGNMPYHMGGQPTFAATRVASPRDSFNSTQTVSPPLTAASGSELSGENVPSVTGYTAYGPMRRGRQSTSDSNTSSSSAPSRNGAGLVQRHSMRYPPGSTNSTVMAAGGRHRRRDSRDDDDDDDFDSDGDAFRPTGAPQEV